MQIFFDKDPKNHLISHNSFEVILCALALSKVSKFYVMSHLGSFRNHGCSLKC
jgi:hypothetical protein